MRRIEKNHCSHELGLHLLFCTKYRKKIFENRIEIELKRVLSQTCAEYNWKIEELEIMPDHVHLFIQVNPTDRPTDIAKTLKSMSALHIFEKFPDLKGRKFWGSGLWSQGVFYGSVSNTNEEVLKRYINNQKVNSSQGTRP